MFWWLRAGLSDPRKGRDSERPGVFRGMSGFRLPHKWLHSWERASMNVDRQERLVFENVVLLKSQDQGKDSGGHRVHGFPKAALASSPRASDVVGPK